MKNQTQYKLIKRTRRHSRIRSRVQGTAERPRLSVYRSNKFIYAQLIDDDAQKTLVSGNDSKQTSGTKTERAIAIGKKIAIDAKAKGITQAVFDRGGFMYTGRVQALADAARQAGIDF